MNDGLDRSGQLPAMPWCNGWAEKKVNLRLLGSRVWCVSHSGLESGVCHTHVPSTLTVRTAKVGASFGFHSAPFLTRRKAASEHNAPHPQNTFLCIRHAVLQLKFDFAVPVLRLRARPDTLSQPPRFSMLNKTPPQKKTQSPDVFLSRIPPPLFSPTCNPQANPRSPPASPSRVTVR